MKDLDRDVKAKIPADAKVLVATPNYTNEIPAVAHKAMMDCVAAWTGWGIDFNWTLVGRTFVHFARTTMCRAAIEGGFTHILWVDDDAIPSPWHLPKFLAHDKDVVICPYPMRRWPHDIGVLKARSGDFHDHGSYYNLLLEDLNQGLIEVDGGGTHLMLVKTSAFDKQGESTADNVLPPMLYEAFEQLDDRGKMLAKQFLGEAPDETRSLKDEDDAGIPHFVMPKSGTEDMYWCYRAKRKGIEIWCDTDTWSDHVGFAPVVTEEWSRYAEKVEREARENGDVPDSGRKLAIIPGQSDIRTPTKIMRDAATNLV